VGSNSIFSEVMLVDGREGAKAMLSSFPVLEVERARKSTAEAVGELVNVATAAFRSGANERKVASLERDAEEAMGFGGGACKALRFSEEGVGRGGGCGWREPLHFRRSGERALLELEQASCFSGFGALGETALEVG
jgi:hypothetical protein